MLTRSSLARMSTPLPRRPDPVLVLLASSVSGGLRPSLAGSTLALTFSRPARRSLLFQPACSLAPFRGLLHQRLRPGPLPTRAAPAASGWSNRCRVGYLPPTAVTHPSHGALRILAKTPFTRSRPAAPPPGPAPEGSARSTARQSETRKNRKLEESVGNVWPDPALP
jgi:hypothetical protein